MSSLEPLGAPLPQVMQILVIAKKIWGFGAVLALFLRLLSGVFSLTFCIRSHF